MKNIQKKKRGKYRIRKTYGGKTYSITLDHKPTQKELDKIFNDFYNKSDTGKYSQDTFERAFHVFITSREHAGKSASTIAGYERIFRQIPDALKHRKIRDIDDFLLQKVVDAYSKDHSWKSAKNFWGLISAVLRYYRKDRRFTVELPKRPNKDKDDYIPNNEDIAKVLRRAKGTPYEIPLQLAAYGLRRSEIVALTIDDLQEDELGWSVHIWRATVQDADNEWVTQSNTKTRYSERTVHISTSLAELIRAQDYTYKGKPETQRLIYKMCPNNIRTNLCKYQDELGIEHFPLHKMRHYFASKAHEMHLSDAEIMAAGGWGTDHVMKTVYRHADKKKVSEAQAKWAVEIEKLTQN